MFGRPPTPTPSQSPASDPASGALPDGADLTPTAVMRRTLIDARIARRLYAIAALFSLVGALLLATASRTAQMPNAMANAALWASFSLLAASLYLLPDRKGQRAMPPFVGVLLTILILDALLSTQRLQAPGLVAAPLLLLLAALLLPARVATGFTLWLIAGLLVLGLVPVNIPGLRSSPPEASTHALYSFICCCVIALLLGRFVATRFTQEARLSVRHEYRYRDLFDRIPSAVLLHDGGSILDANRAALHLMGRARRDDLLGQNLRDYLLGDEAQAHFDARIQQLLTLPVGEVLPLTNFPMRRADGRVVNVRATATALHDLQDDGEQGLRRAAIDPANRRCLSFILDDTERQNALAEALQTRTLLDSIVTHSPYAVSLSRWQDSTVVECNMAFERLVGRSRSDMVGRRTLDIGLWPDAQHRQRFIDTVASASGNAANPTEHTFALMRPAGQVRTVRGIGARLTIDGVDHLLLIGRDVTDALMRDAVHEAIVDTAPVGLAITHGGRIVSANPELHRIFLRPQGSLVGRTTAQVWPDPAAHAHREAQALRDFAAAGRTRFEQEFAFGGHHIVVRIQGRSVSAPGDDMPTVVWIMEDITQEREAARALREAADQAQAASRAKSMFLANISHELRTPLNGILGLLDMTLDGHDPNVERRNLELARESARVLADLLSDVLDLTKIEAGRLRIDEAPFDLRGLLDSLEAVYRVIAEGRNLFLRFDHGAMEDGPYWVMGDPLRVRQILSNFLSNALKFTEVGGVELAVRRPDENGPLRMEVRDSGPGIKADVQERLFQPFEQGDASATRRKGGSGLGLAICRDLAGLMHGAVGLSSTVGRGSTFWVELPLARAAEPARTQDATGPNASFADLRVLVADDNPVNTLIAESMLQRVEARVTGVADGRAALEAVRAAQAEGDPYDIIFMDIQMPVVDGLEATRILRQTHGAQQLPIIALTAGALQSERDAALDAGMNDFVTKPVEREQIVECLARWGRRIPGTS